MQWYDHILLENSNRILASQCSLEELLARASPGVPHVCTTRSRGTNMSLLLWNAQTFATIAVSHKYGSRFTWYFPDICTLCKQLYEQHSAHDHIRQTLPLHTFVSEEKSISRALLWLPRRHLHLWACRDTIRTVHLWVLAHVAKYLNLQCPALLSETRNIYNQFQLAWFEGDQRPQSGASSSEPDSLLGAW